MCLHVTTLAIGFSLLIYQTSMYVRVSIVLPLQKFLYHQLILDIYMRTSNSISIDWQQEYVCFINVSYEVEVLQDGHPTVLTNDTSITIEKLVPNITYAI